MKKLVASSILVLITTSGVYAQTPAPIKTKTTNVTAKPKLIVGLVVDQMRWDFLYRFSAKYTSNGFKRLLSQGYSFENTLINYTPTYTAPGHACVYTGSVPAIHGIAGNNWFDKRTGKNVYCTDDSTVMPVGSSSRAGKMSPDNLWASTITDELKLSNNFKSKVIGIALKDRGAILPAGHSANAAYWYDDAIGKFITSSYYMAALPEWVNSFNNKDLPAAYMSKDWNTLHSIDQYSLSTRDDNAYEVPLAGETKPVFPHRVSELKTGKYSSFKFTPYANTYTFDFAKAAIQSEKLGAGDVTDFLAVSISSTDYIGHSFGPNSIEIEDTYYRLDKDIADFLAYLDNTLGKGNYLFFLTADHGVAHIPAFLKEHKMPAGTFDDYAFVSEINKSLLEEFGMNNIIQNSQNYQLYLNIAEIQKQRKDEAAIKKSIIQLLKAKPYIIQVFETDKLFATTLPQPQKEMMANGYNPVRSGDIMFTVKPAYFDGGARGTTHGLWNPYDAHIPNVWFGWKIPKGKSNRETYMTDIAPTLAALLQIQMPNGSVGKVLEEVVK